MALHGRTRVQMYEGIAKWDIIKEVKNLLIYLVCMLGETGELMENQEFGKMEVHKLHLERLNALINEHIAVREMRKRGTWYLKGI